ncbi:MAG: hypothetical protein IKI69_06490 [Oscillospiraceae bacterium]|nr:hypothetical protein [Oscillospiraceae bacterium]
MKKIVSFLICVLLITAFFSSTTLAANTDQTIIHSAKTVFEDGSYCITTITELRESLKIGFSEGGARATKTASKTNAYYNANGQAVLSATVTGTFSYNGSSATATNAKYSYSITDSAWKFVSGSAGCSGSTATASCKFKQGSLHSKTLSVSLSCSPSGVLS